MSDGERMPRPAPAGDAPEPLDTGAAADTAAPDAPVADAPAPDAPAPDAPAPDAPVADAPPPDAPAPAPSRAVVEPPSPDVALADEATPLPGAHRGGFLRLPTAPVAVTVQTAPAEPGTESGPTPTLPWAMPEPEPAHFSRGLAGWALAFSVTGLAVSLFVGWGFPIGIVGAVSAILALRRPLESRQVAIWALVLGIVSILYSGGWLLFAATRTDVVA